jgi:anti-anti-sigma regulatory factor
MINTMGRYYVSCNPHPKVLVIRFIEPDLRRELDGEPIENCELYRDLVPALTRLSKGDVVVINFGLIARFPTSFYQLLFKVKETVATRKASMMLCGFSADIMEGLEILCARKVFEIVQSEDHAVLKATAKV